MLEQSQYSSKLTRIEKNIERTQKRYTSLFAQLESQAKMMQSQAQMVFQNMFNLGVNSVNPYNYSGMNGFVMNIVGSMLSQGGYKANENATPLQGMDDARIQAMMTEYMQYGKFREKVDPNDATKTLKDQFEGGWSKDEVAAFMTALRAGQMQQQQAQMTVSNLNTQYGNNVSIWLEAQKAQLEAEQDAALEPLTYQQTMLELEKTQKDARLKRIETELQTYTELANKEAESSAPTFGLR